MIKQYKLFFTPTCPHCPPVKAFMKTARIEGEIIDASTPEGLIKAGEFGISSVPAVIFIDEKGKEVKRAGSVEEIKAVLK